MAPEICKTREWRNVDAVMFRNKIVPHSRPAILKGLVADWPAVKAATRSARALADYIGAFAGELPASVMIGSPAIRGRFFYNPDMSGFNFSHEKQSIRLALALLMDLLGEPDPPAIAVQAAAVLAHLPGFEAQNAIDLVAPSVAPKIWIGNAVTVAAHFDLNDNIACVVGGRRRFTLFPPDQVRNLYSGPLELTPAGMPVSLVDFDAPDLDRYPRFEAALAAAEVAEVEAGDAVYIPYMWWHHVRSLEPFNVLVNYWWNQTPAGVGSPLELMLMALISLRDLPPSYRDAWRGFFEHWIYQADGDPVAHVPPERRGGLGGTTPGFRRIARSILARSLGDDKSPSS